MVISRTLFILQLFRLIAHQLRMRCYYKKESVELVSFTKMEVVERPVQE